MTTVSEPAWLRHARTLLGTREAAGAANSKTILGWAAKLGNKALGIAYNADSVPWCGLFVAHCFRTATPTIPLPPIAVRASAWDAFGVARAPCLGAVLRFARDGGGHVAFAIGEDKTHYHVLGGNQGDRVSIMRIEKSRLVASRVPVGWVGAGQPLPKMLATAGVPVSSDEA
jgi:uncharacterized protein (TIGR02594 family)